MTVEAGVAHQLLSDDLELLPGEEEEEANAPAELLEEFDDDDDDAYEGDDEVEEGDEEEEEAEEVEPGTQGDAEAPKHDVDVDGDSDVDGDFDPLAPLDEDNLPDLPSQEEELASKYGLLSLFSHPPHQPTAAVANTQS